MTQGETALMRVLGESGRLAQLPFEIVRMIVRHLNLPAKVHYLRRRSLPRLFDEMMFPQYVGDPLRTHDQHPLSGIAIPYNKPFYGPGY